MSLIELKNLNKTFGSGDAFVQALNSVDLTIEYGAFAAVSGPSGSGKSTLLNIIGLLDQPTSGEYLFDGKLINYHDHKRINHIRSHNLGFIFQNYNLLPVLTALENVEMSALQSISSNSERKKQAQLLLDQVGLSDKLNSFPNQLSGGQQQRVSVARSLMGSPKLVLADEPTANLDSSNTFKLIELMKSLNQKLNISFLFSTHDNRILDNVNNIINLTDGRVDK